MKKMFKQLSLLLVAVLLGTLMFSSCDKDAGFNVKKNIIDKKWELSTVEADAFTQSMFDMMLALISNEYDFKADGTYTLKQVVMGIIPATTNGTWSISDDFTELTIDGETSPIIEATADVLKIGPSGAIMGSVDEDGDIEEDMDYVIVFEAI